MEAFIVTALVGALCIWIGLSNRKGNLSALHSYHRKRVSEEDRIPFGKQVGLGNIIIGIGLILFGAFSALMLYTQKEIFIIIGTALMILSLLVGLVLSFHAMIKYNKGIF